MTEKALVEKTGDKSNSPEAHAHANVGVGTFLAIAAFGISCVALGMTIMEPRLMDAKLNAIQDAATRAENHARTAEQNTQVLEKLLEEKRNGR